jgi:hypothetical protein
MRIGPISVKYVVFFILGIASLRSGSLVKVAMPCHEGYNNTKKTDEKGYGKE